MLGIVFIFSGSQSFLSSGTFLVQYLNLEPSLFFFPVVRFEILSVIFVLPHTDWLTSIWLSVADSDQGLS